MKFALILAGGVGKRAGGSLPKQFREIGGKPLLLYCKSAFLNADPETCIVFVMHKDYMEAFRNSIIAEGNTTFVEGGPTRIESVKNGLKYIADKFDPKDDDLVMIHDGARPLVTPDMIKRGTQNVETNRGFVPVVAMTDSIRKKIGPKTASVDRNDYVAVQTPQIFRFKDIYEAYKNVSAADKSLTDDASVAEKNGMLIDTFEGDSNNIKITNPLDFKIAEAIIHASKE